ncbi:hypothetical protein IQ16_07751 [Bradyrhizobium huanghuaihaiense]|uniref:Uncharacterized protein n=1 Tax=Bradyrhizobium huanghuaihaiense TaxID=990078 RepID=A0A562QUF0_9BRAD|nr:hypothetical protein [Bradyrhizobium huanghuaihaiense]TWI60253.1 hypothetical protein IQ16_07751 [Bradyrhizobium huanghuaihaiense]
MSSELPDQISLAQVALWITRGIRPVPERLFAGTKARLDENELGSSENLRRLLALLADGELTATARISVVYEGEDPLAPTPVAQIGPFEVPASTWFTGEIRWNASALEIREGFDLPPELFHTLNFSGDFLAWGNRAFFQPVMLATEEVLSALPALNSPVSGAAVRPNVGRPAKYDWPDFYAAAAAWIYESGIPKTQADMVKAMAQWCQNNWDTEPGDTELKGRIRRFLDRFKKEVGN